MTIDSAVTYAERSLASKTRRCLVSTSWEVSTHEYPSPFTPPLVSSTVAHPTRLSPGNHLFRVGSTVAVGVVGLFCLQP
jgi:hypothetical protein